MEIRVATSALARDIDRRARRRSSERLKEFEDAMLWVSMRLLFGSRRKRGGCTWLATVCALVAVQYRSRAGQTADVDLGGPTGTGSVDS
jgi:hypothetical protein